MAWPACAGSGAPRAPRSIAISPPLGPALSCGLRPGTRYPGPAVARPMDGQRSAPVLAHHFGAPRRAPAGPRRRQAQGRTLHLAVRDAGTGDPRRNLSRFARAARPVAGNAPLPSRAEASLGRLLASDGRARNPRLGRQRRSRSTAPFSPATAAERRRSSRRR